MSVTSGVDAQITIDGDNLSGLQDADFSRERIELNATTVGDDAQQRELGIKDASCSFSGVVDAASDAFKKLLDAARDGDEIEVVYDDGTISDNKKIEKAIVTSLQLDAGVEQLVEFSCDVLGTDEDSGWVIE